MQHTKQLDGGLGRGISSILGLGRKADRKARREEKLRHKSRTPDEPTANEKDAADAVVAEGIQRNLPEPVPEIVVPAEVMESHTESVKEAVTAAVNEVHNNRWKQWRAEIAAWVLVVGVIFVLIGMMFAATQYAAAIGAVLGVYAVVLWSVGDKVFAGLRQRLSRNNILALAVDMAGLAGLVSACFFVQVTLGLAAQVNVLSALVCGMIVMIVLLRGDHRHPPVKEDDGTDVEIETTVSKKR